MKANVKSGDFTALAQNYSVSRPDYSPTVLKAISRYFGESLQNVDCVDVGAGTGIWSRMVNSLGVRSMIAIEPNEQMRKFGSTDSFNKNIIWKEGCAEQTGLANNSVHWLSMASSFHWTDSALALEEFNRVLSPGGLLCLLWNPRRIEKSGITRDIEQLIQELKPGLERVSSGYSKFTENLYDSLVSHASFEDVIYLEGQHQINMPRERYIQVWRSVNDIQSQLGAEKFSTLMNFIQDITSTQECISTRYVTRAWVAVNKK